MKPPDNPPVGKPDQQSPHPPSSTGRHRQVLLAPDDFLLKDLPRAHKGLWIAAARLVGHKLARWCIESLDAAARETIRQAIARGKPINPAILQQMDQLSRGESAEYRR